ncbi:hypothetical protein [Sphingomonas radiodurans]|uniref:hypothetical protein n=1 Tax=Sphingomonas radiodurans TaxID=2890321 RepID=UPI001E60883A|nr:hypothetical protein [Sphingomonas radiodurans]WBH16628.1 hypothetical protein LLW23_00390 [Sphingomonas radiodurans]
MTVKSLDNVTRGFGAAPIAMLGAFALILPAGAMAQSTEEIVTQPARDVGITKKEIPPLLVKTSEAPYTPVGAANCAQIASSIAALTAEIGPDFSTSPTTNKRNIAKLGGAAVINSLMPFRGIIREVSGASAAERRMNLAIDAGIARRGFLRGLQVARKCRV